MRRERVPIKNIAPVLVDVKKPGFDYQRSFKFSKLNLSNVPEFKAGFSDLKPYKRFLRWGLMAAAGLLVLTSGFVFLNLRGIKAAVLEKGELIFRNFAVSVEALKGFRPAAAEKTLEENNKELTDLNAILAGRSAKTFFSLLGSLWPAVKEAGTFLNEASGLNFKFLVLADALGDLQLNGFSYFQNDGTTLLNRLRLVQETIKESIRKIEAIRNSTANLKNISPFFANAENLLSEDYLKSSAELHNLDGFLTSLLGVLDSGEEKHILLLFQNPAEIRPAGGFLGSYGDLVVEQGQMKKLAVQDIYWPDHPLNFNLKIIPPEALQAVTKDWGARDGNWFFDFPTSAKTVISFLENSEVYKEPGVVFEGALALNINVLESILGFIGPVDIADYDLTINKENFLFEIQREVETGRDHKKGSNPKKILSVITPTILERLGVLTNENKVALIEAFGEHFSKKDIMFFAKDSNLASFFNSRELDGAVLELPSSFWGSYLAVVNANIAGGKSDAFIRQSVEVRVEVDTEGGVLSDVTVSRTHDGNTQKDSWWRATNQNYIQIFVNPGSSLISLKGNDIKKFEKPVYGKEYAINEMLDQIEKTKVFLADYNTWSLQAFGKTVFATWWNIPAGKTETLNLRYESKATTPTVLEAGKPFRYIFERQSGVKSSVKITIGAPLGYVWAESQNPIFIYENEDPDARVILDLTLSR